MNRLSCIALLATLCFASNALAIDKTPAAMKRVIDKAVSEVKRNRQDFDKANEAPLEEAKEELQDLAKKFIEEGKTEEAQTVLRQVKSLDADVLRMAKAPEPAPAPEPRPGPQKPLLERLAGKWTHPNCGIVFVCQPQGTCKEIKKSDQSVWSTGHGKAVSPDVAEFILSNGYKLICRPAGNDAVARLVMTPDGKPEGEGQVFVRVE